MAYKMTEYTGLQSLEMIANAAQKRYINMKEGYMLYGLGRHTFEKLVKDSGARRRIGQRIIVNTEVLNQYIEDMFEDNE